MTLKPHAMFAKLANTTANLAQRRVCHALPVVGTYQAFLGSPAFHVLTALCQCNRFDTPQIHCPVVPCASLAGRAFLVSAPRVQAGLETRPIMQLATSALKAPFPAMGSSVLHAQLDAVPMLSRLSVTCVLSDFIAKMDFLVSNVGRTRSRHPIENGVCVLLARNQFG